MENKFNRLEELAERFVNIKTENGLVKKIDLHLIGHFGNIVTFDMPIEVCGGTSNPIGGFNSTLSCGVYLRVLFDLWGISEDDGKRISEIKDVPCRIVRQGFNIIAIGNFISDKFVVIDDLPKLYEEFVKKVEKDEQ